jgi:CHAT domain-containing protein/tetratricopeptide (TPR) repeat protein
MKRQLFFITLCGAAYFFITNQQVGAQISTDSIRKQHQQLLKAQSLQEKTVAMLQIQKFVLSDSQFVFARQFLEQSRKKFSETHYVYASALSSVAILHMWRAEYEKALPLLQQSYDIVIKNYKDSTLMFSAVLNNLGLTYFRLGEPDKALLFCGQALALRKGWDKEKPPYILYYPLSLQQVSEIYSSIHNYDRALPLLEEAVAVREKAYTTNHHYYALSLHSLGQLYTLKGNYKTALPLLQKTVRIFDSTMGQDDLDYILAVESLAILYSTMGRNDEALHLFEEVLEWRRKKFGSRHPQYAYSLNNVGTLATDATEAASLFCRADTILLAHLKSTYTALSEREKIAYLNEQSRQFHYLPSLIFLNSLQQPALLNQLYENELVLKSMVLEDQKDVLRSIRQSGDTNLLTTYGQWHSSKALLGKVLLNPKFHEVVKPDSLTEIVNRLEQQLSVSSSKFRKIKHAQNITISDIANNLRKGEAAIEFMRFKLYNKKWTDSIIYAATILLPGDSVARFVSLFEEKQLARLITFSSREEADKALFDLYPPDAAIAKTSAAGSALYNLIWKPLTKELKGSHTIYYAPVGLLHRISFAALRQGANHVLIDKYHLHQVLSTRSVVLHNTVAKGYTNATVWGNIDYNFKPQANSAGALTAKRQGKAPDAIFNLINSDVRGGQRGRGWNALSGTRKELANISKVLKNAGIGINAVSGQKATEEAFKALDGKSPQIVHLATHGFFFPVKAISTERELNKPGGEQNAFTVQQNPMFRSGLVLAGGNITWQRKAVLPDGEDGILTAYDISQMDLGNTQLLVLSACETGLGDVNTNEGVIGLQRAFKLAGVKQIVHSLWYVPDQETNELMTKFYQQLVKGRSPREALRAAQLSVRKVHAPFYWAGFVLVE